MTLNPPPCGATHPLLAQYHDTEWGIPNHDDHLLFEQITLLTAGLTFPVELVLPKRKHYIEAFHGLVPERVAAMTTTDLEPLMVHPFLIKNPRKMNAILANARAFTAVQRAEGTFAKWWWAFVNGQPMVNNWPNLADVPDESPLAITIAKALKKREFQLLGPKTTYQLMQLSGLVNDHLTNCPRHKAVQRERVYGL
jgi:DNA-3-methyladenine glycosylase I